MIEVLVSKQANYPVSTPKIKKHLREVFTRGGIVSEATVDVSLVGEKEMLSLGKKYLRDNKLHNVFSFVPDEIKSGFVYPPDGRIQLGEIIICYPKALAEAKEEGVLIETKVLELVEHGAQHLLGHHHN